MAGFNPFSALMGGLTQRLQTSPFAGLLGIGQGAPEATPQPPVVQPAQSTAPAQFRDTTGLPADGGGNDLRGGITSSAQALGIDPLDLATVISYETGGTFDPNKKGPTTQYGTHRGFIQFGEPQAREYGVDWNNSAGSQLGPDGAIVKYMRQAGVKPGMGLLDIYSAVNAGHVGRYNASDAANGGAPGTVQDKVLYQMDDHRKKARELLGGTYQPGPMSAPPSALDRVFAAASGQPLQGGFPGPQGAASGSPADGQAQPQSVLQRALAAAKGGPTSRLGGGGARMQSGQGSDGQGAEGAVDLGAQEVAALSQSLNQRKLTPSQKAAQRRENLKKRTSQV